MSELSHKRKQSDPQPPLLIQPQHYEVSVVQAGAMMADPTHLAWDGSTLGPRWWQPVISTGQMGLGVLGWQGTYSSTHNPKYLE